MPSGEYVGPVAIGEITDDADDFHLVTVPELYGDDVLPARRVKWLATQTKSKFSPEMIKKFPRPNAFRSLPREFYQEVYSVAYKSYVIEDSYTARFETTEVDFTTIDNYYVTQIINSVAALSEIYEKADMDVGAIRRILARKGNGLDELVNIIGDTTFIPDLTVNIASPGFLTATCRKAVPLVATALIALTALGADAVWEAAEAGTIKVVNSQAPTDSFCNPPIAAEVVDQVKMMGFERWKKMCEVTSGFKERTGLNGESKAKKAN